MSFPVPLSLNAAVEFPTASGVHNAQCVCVFNQLIEWEMFVNAGNRDSQPTLNESVIGSEGSRRLLDRGEGISGLSDNFSAFIISIR